MVSITSSQAEEKTTWLQRHLKHRALGMKPERFTWVWTYLSRRLGKLGPRERRNKTVCNPPPGAALTKADAPPRCPQQRGSFYPSRLTPPLCLIEFQHFLTVSLHPHHHPAPALFTLQNAKSIMSSGRFYGNQKKRKKKIRKKLNQNKNSFLEK